MIKRLIMLCLCGVLFVPAVFADDENVPCEVTIIEEHDYSGQLVEKIKMQRDTIYNALNLTPRQIKCKNEIEKKRYLELEPALKNFCICNKKLKDAKAANDTELICTAEKNLKSSRKEIQNVSAKYDKEFIKILNSEQRSKYQMIRKLKRTDLKKLQKIQKDGAKSTDVKPFGIKMNQAEYTEKRKQESCLKNKFKRKNK